ncbi:MAG TPA: TIGR04219 family outer membrane beta-barrel protein [Gammaproteobacteria bacterium]|nr:TIGR04219 family outer membrane beta-barrel protein [Gammaproteobacteria bacterium]
MKLTWSVYAISACLGLASGAAEAEFIGLNIGASQLGAAQQSASSGAGFELVDDLDSEPTGQSSMVLILEHPITALPNIRYQGLPLDLPRSSSSNLNRADATADETRTNYDLSQDDIVLYYQLPGNQVNLDLGVDLKRFAGEISIDGPIANRIDIDETIPLLYLSARYDLSNSGFYIGANINSDIANLGISKSTAQDSTFMLGYDSGSGLGVEGGYKSFSLNLDNVDTFDSSLEYDGLYLNGYFNF